MHFGFYLPSSGQGAQPDELASIARLGDRLGYFCMVAPDHILLPTNVESVYPYSITGSIVSGGRMGAGEWPEQITTLAFLAGVTEDIRLATSVMIVPYRNPLLTAKMLATVDVLSKGRLIVGAGVGWMEEEFEMLDTPPFSERGAVTDEYLRAYIELWSSGQSHLRRTVHQFLGPDLPTEARPEAAPADLDRRPVQSRHPQSGQDRQRLASGGRRAGHSPRTRGARRKHRLPAPPRRAGGP